MERITILLENTFGHDLDSNYLIEDNYRYSNDRDIIQISIIDFKLQQRIKKSLEVSAMTSSSTRISQQNA